MPFPDNTRLLYNRRQTTRERDTHFTQTTLFCSCDLDLDPMTFMRDLAILNTKKYYYVAFVFGKNKANILSTRVPYTDKYKKGSAGQSLLTVINVSLVDSCDQNIIPRASDRRPPPIAVSHSSSATVGWPRPDTLRPPPCHLYNIINVIGRDSDVT